MPGVQSPLEIAPTMAERSIWYFGPRAGWVARRVRIASIIYASSSPHLDAGELYDFCILGRFCADEIAKRRGCVANGLRCLCLEGIAYVGVLQCSDGRLGQLFEYGLRRAGAREQAEPVGEIEIVESLRLGHARDARKCRRSLLARHRDGLERSGL